MKWSEEQSEKSGVPPENSDRKMNEFVTVSQGRTVTAHGIFNTNGKRDDRNNNVNQFHVNIRSGKICMQIIKDNQSKECKANNQNSVDGKVVPLCAEKFAQ